MSERIVQLTRNILFLNYVRNDSYKLALINTIISALDAQMDLKINFNFLRYCFIRITLMEAARLNPSSG
jgi:hypothetical protein